MLPFVFSGFAVCTNPTQGVLTDNRPLRNSSSLMALKSAVPYSRTALQAAAAAAGPRDARQPL